MKDDYVLLFSIALAHIAVSYVVNRLSYMTLSSLRLHMVPSRRETRFYEKVLHIRSWKDYVPSVGPFDKKDMKGDDAAYISMFILETVRAEVAHVLCISVTLLLLLYHRQPYSAFIPVFYLVINIPCILIQRYNRPRLERVLKMHSSRLVIPEEEETGPAGRPVLFRRR